MALATSEWDAVVDTWSGAPRAVRDSAGALADRAGRYLYVSSRSGRGGPDLIDPEVVTAAGIQPWSELPCWVPPGDPLSGLVTTNVDRAYATGLRCRPIEETVADTWAWLASTRGIGHTAATSIDLEIARSHSVGRMTESPVTLITGGSSGIGAAAARRLLAQGHRVAVTGRDPGRLDLFVKGFDAPAGLLAFAGDAADYDAVRTAVDGTVAEFGRLDTVVANAGFATHDTLADGDPAGWREMVLTNVLGPALLIRASLAALRESRGRIVLVGSVAGFVHTPGNIYGATKWAVTGLAENTRLMVTGDGIGVTLIAPGRVETALWADSGLPDGHLLSADDLAESIVWAINQPPGVDVNTVIVRPVGQPV